MTEKIIDRIIKLLETAESLEGPAAESYTERAEELMIRHGIEQAMLDSRQSDRVGSGEKIVQRLLESEGIYAQALHDIAMVTCVTLQLPSVQLVRAGERSWRGLYVIGFESDADNALALCKSLQTQAMTAMQAWWASDESAAVRSWSDAYRRFKEREAFLYGFMSATTVRLRKTRARVVDEVTRESGAGTELALLDRSTALEKQRDEWYPNLEEANEKRNIQGSASSRWSGLAAGERADIGQTAVDDRAHGELESGV